MDEAKAREIVLWDDEKHNANSVNLSYYWEAKGFLQCWEKEVKARDAKIADLEDRKKTALELFGAEREKSRKLVEFLEDPDQHDYPQVDGRAYHSPLCKACKAPSHFQSQDRGGENHKEGCASLIATLNRFKCNCKIKEGG